MDGEAPASVAEPDYARWTRVAAFFLDQAIVFPVSYLLMDLDLRLFALIAFLVFVGWRALWILVKGATPGKALLGLEVCEFVSLGRPSARQAVVRELPIGACFLAGVIHPMAGVVSLFLVFPLLGLVTLGMISSGDGRTIGDRVAGTIVMER